MKQLPLFLLALLLAPVHAQARPHFLITEITYPGIISISPRAINNLGQVTGTLVDQHADFFAFFYSGGQTVEIPSGYDSAGLAINNHGVVVGGYSNGYGSLIWPGTFIPFGPANSFAYGINDSGTVVGGPSAYVYKSGVVIDLGLGPESTATGINNSGQVVGNNGSSGSGTFLWRNGHITSLPLLNAIAINNNGDILGYIQSASGNPQPVLDVEGLLINIPLRAGTTDSVVYALNDRDHVVGIVQLNGKTIEPFLWNGRFWLLNSLIPAGSGWVLRDAEGINGKGQIVGSGTLNGIVAGYILTPLREAGTE
jgi:uncharacterized membrane protein